MSTIELMMLTLKLQIKHKRYVCTCKYCGYSGTVHENSVGLSSATNPKHYYLCTLIVYNFTSAYHVVTCCL